MSKYDGRLLAVVVGVLTPVDAIDATNTTLYTPVLDLKHATDGTIQYVWTGGSTPVVTETFWGSNKERPVLTTDADWEDITALLEVNVDVTTNDGVASQRFSSVGGAGLYRYVRGKLVRGSGSTPIVARAVAKDLRN